MPAKTAGERLEFEPELMLQDLAPGNESHDTVSADVERASAGLERAKRKAARWQQLYKQGVLSRVEAEGAAFQVLQWAMKFAVARAQSLRRELESQRQKLAAGTATQAEVDATESAARETDAALAQTKADLQRARLEAASANLARQRRLHAAGLVSKSQLRRAEAALREAQSKLD